jgi:hypothetical protein
MCAGCALLATSAAAGARQVLAVVHPKWIKRGTIVLIVAALIGSTIGVKGSDHHSGHSAGAAVAHVAHAP